MLTLGYAQSVALSTGGVLPERGLHSEIAHWLRLKALCETSSFHGCRRPLVGLHRKPADARRRGSAAAAVA